MVNSEKVANVFSRRLSVAMEARGFTIYTLAREIGITHNCFYGYLEGRRMPRLDYALAISGALGVSLDWMVGRKGVKRGAWLPQDGAMGEMCQCSECGAVLRNYGQDKFCRECGAKMDGGKT